MSACTLAAIASVSAAGFQIAVFGINGPISASPHNYIWMRTATLDLPREGRPLYAAHSALPWPEASRRAARVAGAWVVIAGGRPA